MSLAYCSKQKCVSDFISYLLATTSEESKKSRSGGGGDTSEVFNAAAADNSNEVTDEERKQHREMALEVARSPKLATKSKPIQVLFKFFFLVDVETNKVAQNVEYFC